LLGISNVKAYTNEKFEANRFRESVARTVRTAIKSGKVRALFVSMLNFLVYSAIVFIIWYGAWQMHRQTLSFGDLTAFVIYTALVGASMSNLADLYGQLQKIFGAAGRIRELFAQPIEGTIDEIPCSSPSEYKLTGAVELDNVSFYYPSRPDLTVLKNISLKAGKGEKIAVVGPSGAGKTTLVSLLLRFYDPVSGKILFDGIDALSIPLRHLREQIAIIPQDVLLFGGTIRENIAYGRPNVSAEELEEASKKAFAHDFIAGFPEGYDTVVGERGVRLSGGQRQRISIARAILKDARILILDEATSSLDSSSELMVQKAMDALFKDRTAFIIAHRLSTIRNADRIIVIDRGTIKESGTHHELVNEEDSLYRALNELQSQS
jgi:ABC-type multidrug transport system fused ATPase/permease subunit